MFLGIDISGDTIRHGLRTAGEFAYHQLHGTCGLAPRFTRDRFLWNRPKAVRSSNPGHLLAVAEAWRAFGEQVGAIFSWAYENGDTGQKYMAALIGEALSQCIPASQGALSVLSVSNYLQESHQEALLTALTGSGVADTTLLWRPIAIALSFLTDYGSAYSPGDRLLIIDSECRPPEATVIELRGHETGVLVPLRHPPKAEHMLDLDFDILAIRRRIAAEISKGDPDVADQLCCGPFAAEFIAATEMEPYKAIWCRQANRYVHLPIDEAGLQRRIRDLLQEGLLPDLMHAVKAKHDFSGMSAIVWHGWPFRCLFRSRSKSKHFLAGVDAVCRGAALYADRLAQRQPTYMDTLPGLYILSEVRELNAHCFFHLVQPTTIEGGKTWKRETPLTRFSVRKGLREFTAVLRKSDEAQCRRVVTQLPQTPLEDTPVLIRAEAKPASGYAQVTIEGAEGHRGIFGELGRIKLNWKSMEKIDIPIVYAPEACPVKGRLFDEQDPEYKQVLIDFLKADNANLYSIVQYKGHGVVFHQLLEPWGLRPPWPPESQPSPWQAEPARGMFGSVKLPIEEHLLEKLAQRIQKIMHQDRVKFLNYMFVFAPESFKTELRGKYSQTLPSFDERVLRGRPRPSWNWAIAPGRVFSTSQDFELLLDFLIRHGEDGYPKYPDETFTQHYWWSFFRCLCYHVDTVHVPPAKVIAVLDMIVNYVKGGKHSDKVLKYCLCAILFSLRIRLVYPDFLQPVDNSCIELVDLVQNAIRRIPYPQTMLSSAHDPTGEGLNGLVLRFLMQTADRDDYSAIEGLTTSMA